MQTKSFLIIWLLSVNFEKPDHVFYDNVEGRATKGINNKGERRAKKKKKNKKIYYKIKLKSLKISTKVWDINIEILKKRMNKPP